VEDEDICDDEGIDVEEGDICDDEGAYVEDGDICDDDGTYVEDGDGCSGGEEDALVVSCNDGGEEGGEDNEGYC
jgi:hypothetical protein